MSYGWRCGASCRRHRRRPFHPNDQAFEQEQTVNKFVEQKVGIVRKGWRGECGEGGQCGLSSRLQRLPRRPSLLLVATPLPPLPRCAVALYLMFTPLCLCSHRSSIVTILLARVWLTTTPTPPDTLSSRHVTPRGAAASRVDVSRDALASPTV